MVIETFCTRNQNKVTSDIILKLIEFLNKQNILKAYYVISSTARPPYIISYVLCILIIVHDCIPNVK